MNTPLIIDLAKDDLPTGVLDFSSWTGTGPAVIVTCTAPTFADNRRKTLRGLEIKGPGRDKLDTTGVFFCAAAHSAMEDCRIYGFGKGLVFGDDVWGMTFTNVNVHGCHTCIHYPMAKNSGEVLAFFGGALFNSVEAVRTSYGPSLQFFGTAFDYCTERTFIIEGGAEIGLHGCHIETRHVHQAGNHIVEIGPGRNRFLMNGGTIWMTEKTWGGGQYTAHVKPWLKNQGDLVRFDGTRMHNMRGEYFQEGDGKLVTRDLTVYNTNLPLKKRRWFQWGPKLGQNSFWWSPL